MSDIEKIKTIKDQILVTARESSFAGSDPFDGLNSRFFSLFPGLKKGKLGLAWIQLNKRSPINLRPLLQVPPARNPKGVALFILGLIEDYKRTKDSAYLDEAVELANWLLMQQSDKDIWKNSCWGYHFDWNARAFFVPKGKPNVITTIYVAQALYALSEINGNDLYRNAAINAADFIVETLYTEADGRVFFAYIPGEDAFVHNASLWGAAWVAFVGQKTANDRYKTLALKVARQSVSEQFADGSWVYGARHHHQFIDGFHTGYNLEALDLLRRSLGVSEFDDSIRKGIQYYKSELIDADGTAKYYNKNKYPLDMHSVTQLVITLLKVGGKREDLELARKVINKSLENLYVPSKSQFLYQRYKYYSNGVDYMRWTQAWVYYSFSMYACYLKNAENNSIS